ncbi:hypothetical protein [Kribbella sp. NPDC003557]|uniref:hypothetical protein n=1 Tax=Kribbella sp. NPDC003557 TaxID=3154449 RepID=UPI0033A07229
MRIAVYGVAQPAEARWLESAGADVIGLVVDDRANGRILDMASAKSVADAVDQAAVCVELRENGSALAVARGLAARWVQVPWNLPAAREWREELAAGGIGWTLGRVPADEDDDPEWITRRWTEYGDPAPDWVQVEIFPNLTDGWPILQEPSPDEVDATDLDQMAAERPILFSLPLTADRAGPARALLPHAHGFGLTLADRADRADLHLAATTVELDAALHIIEALRR